MDKRNKILLSLVLVITILIPFVGKANTNDDNSFNLEDYLDSSNLSETVKEEIRSNIDKIEQGDYKLTYELFGAKGDGITNDSDAIREAHNFANQEYAYNNKMIEVQGSKNSTYYISEVSEPILIGTNVNWNGCNFIFDDGVDNIDLTSSIFKVVNKMSIKIPNTYFPMKTDILSELGISINKNTNDLSALVNYIKNMNSKDRNGISVEKFELMKEELNTADKYLIEVINSKKKISKRYNTSNSDSLQDRFVIDKNGKVLNKITWDFDDITSFRIYPIYEEQLVIKNANITTRTNNIAYTTDGKKTDYVKRNILITASNVKIENITHFIDENYYPNKNNNYQDRENANTYNGIIETETSAYLDFNNIKLSSHTYPHNLKNGQINYSGTYGTYDMLISKSVNTSLNNINYVILDGQDEDAAYYENMLNTDTRWSTVAMKYNKDISFTNCKLNTISSHEGTYNISIKDSTIGKRGIILLGGNDFVIDNVTIDQAPSLLKFHDDYGATWNGNIYLNNVNYIAGATNYSMYLINVNRSETWDFGYDLYFPNIYIDGFHIDDSKVTESKKIYLIGMRESESIDTSYKENDNYNPYTMPNDIVLKNIETSSERGINIFSNHFIESDYLKQSRYNNNGDSEKTNIKIEKSVKLNKDEKTELYNIEDGQFNIELVPTVYTILEGANQIINDGEDLTIRVSGTIDKFLNIKIDDKLVEENNYTVKSGSTIITINSNYLKKLDNGKHSLTIIYTDGEVSTEFEIKRDNKTSDTINDNQSSNDSDVNKKEKNHLNNISKVPKTYDNIIKITIIFVLATIGFVVSKVMYRKNSKGDKR